MWRSDKPSIGRRELISAAEVAAWAYCPESWRLHYGQGLEPDNRASLDAGTRHHARKAFAERLAGAAILLGWLLAVLAGAGLLFLLWVR